jgi:hypothetical protein
MIAIFNKSTHDMQHLDEPSDVVMFHENIRCIPLSEYASLEGGLSGSLL